MVQTFQVGLDDAKARPVKAKKNLRSKGQGSSQATSHRAGDKKSKNSPHEIEDEDMGETDLVNEKEDRKKDENKVSLVIGIDFGTTHSAAWAGSDDEFHEVKIMEEWPGTYDHRHKVPTAIVVGTAMMDDEVMPWGYEIRPGMPSSSWFKLLMAEKEHLVPQDDPLLRQAVGQGLLDIPEGYSEEDLGEKYLQHLHDYIMEKAELRFGKTLLQETPIKYVMTVPADWGINYKEKLKRVAAAAGIPRRPGDTVTFISEPEAAARAAFQSQKSGLSKFVFKKDINTVIVDMGGGTVVRFPGLGESIKNGMSGRLTWYHRKDLITYRILRAKDPIKVVEACAGNSGKCGGTSIDRALHELMVQKYGVAFSEKETTEISHGSAFMDQFEHIKRKFENKDCQYELPLTMDLEEGQGYDPRTRKVNLTRDEIAEMFSSVVDPTLALLDQQMTKSKDDDKNINVQVVVLCGGLSGSKYIQNQIRAFCGDGDIEVIVPDSPWSAIARGATQYGMYPKSLVAARKCRQSYGMSVHRKREEEEEDVNEEDAMDCPIYGPRVKGCMKWHVRKEDTIKNRSQRIHAYILFDKRRSPLGEIQLYKCNSQNPPDKVNGTGVREFCKLQIDLSGIRGSSSSSQFKRAKRSKKTKVEIKIDQQVHIETDEVEFVAKVNQKVVGCKKARYETAEELENHD